MNKFNIFAKFLLLCACSWGGYMIWNVAATLELKMQVLIIGALLVMVPVIILDRFSTYAKCAKT